MFLCRKCHPDDKNCPHPFKSYGPCENCGLNDNCSDCHNRGYPKQPQTPAAPQRLVLVTPGTFMLPPAERAKLRPPDYASRSAEEQWAIDKDLGLLDWDGK